MKFAHRLALDSAAITILAVAIAVVALPYWHAWAIVAAIGAAIIASRWTAARRARPLGDLVVAARKLEDGADQRVGRTGWTEVDGLASAIRAAHAELHRRGQQTEEARAGAAAMLDAMVEGVVAADASGRVTVANAAARQLLRFDAAAELPPLPLLFHTTAAREAVDRVLQGDEVRDTEIEVADRILLLNARPLETGGAVLVLHDLTQSRRVEAVRRDFVANVSHELRTPLTSIAGFAETIADPAIDPVSRARFTAAIRANAVRMQRLVDDLLDLARIESGRWTPRRADCDVEPIAADAWDTVEPRATARQVTLAMRIAPDATTLHVDRDALRQILVNLFDNAVRYSRPGGVVRLRTARVGAGVDLTVEDDGSGIAAEHLDRIFERFYRVDPSRSREEGGTGLGLSIVRHLVEAHGGNVSADSALQQGTTLRCWFPD